MQAEKGNKNGRIYPSKVMFPEVARYKKEVIAAGRALGELGHPAGPHLNLERVSHKILDLWAEDNNVYGRAKILPTPYGDIVKSFIDEGIKFGVSSRALGSLVSKGDLQEVQDDFWLSTVDIVHDPSAPEAFVEGLMEGKEWIFENGIIKEMTIEQYKEAIKTVRSRELEAKKLEVFEDFMRRLSSK